MIVASGNDYLIGVKGNQPTLWGELKRQAQQDRPASTCEEVDTSHGRRVRRRVRVFDDVDSISSQWLGVQSLICVERQGWRDRKPFYEVHFYFSSLKGSAQELARGIRGHWSIENSLHWVKDGVFREDRAPYTDPNCATNWSIIRNIALNLIRINGFTSLTKAIRACAHDLERLFSFFQ